MPTSPLPPHLVVKVCHKALPSVFLSWVSGAGRFGELQLHGWTPVSWYSALTGKYLGAPKKSALTGNFCVWETWRTTVSHKYLSIGHKVFSIRHQQLSLRPKWPSTSFFFFCWWKNIILHTFCCKFDYLHISISIGPRRTCFFCLESLSLQNIWHFFSLCLVCG